MKVFSFGDVSMKDIVPVENMKTTSSKIEVLPQVIDLYSAKIFLQGNKTVFRIDAAITCKYNDRWQRLIH